MRRVKSFISIRNRKDLKTRSWDIVFEWEDILAKGLGLGIDNYKMSYGSILIQKLGLGRLFFPFMKKRDIRLQFVTDISLKKGYYASCNTIPIIIDFWYDSDEEINLFIEHFKFVPLLILTNLEVYNLLKSKTPPFPIAHMGLSLPDQYALTEKIEKNNKEYEFGFIGRVDQYFLDYIERYAISHPEFTYVLSKGYSYDREYWTNKGESLGKDKGRESYIDYLQRTKITCYSTPGMDLSKKVTYNQVTPRVLEMLANGCMVMGHYPLSDDVKWYSLDKVVPNINSYKEFEDCLNEWRKRDFDYDKISQFLSGHYTSARINVLRQILTSHGLL